MPSAARTPFRISPGDGAAHEQIHALLHAAFRYMAGRIDPPSSLHRLTPADIAEQAERGEVWVLREGSGEIPTATEDGPLAACVFFTPKPGALYLGKLAVARQYRGQGFARRLIDLAERRAATLSLPYLELQTRIELVENHAAFERLGFHRSAVGRHPGYDHDTECTMRKAVTWPVDS